MTADAAHPHYTAQKPRRRTEPVDVADFTMLVQVPGRPDATHAFTAAEDADARQYAAETGGTIVPLPPLPPKGYIVGPRGNLVPAPAGTAGTPSLTTDA